MNLVQKLIDKTRESRKVIAFVGDAMTDIYIHGRMEPSQDGCDKFLQDDIFTCVGGSLNAERSLIHWEGKTLSFCNPWGRECQCPKKTRFLIGDNIVFRHDDDRIAPQAILSTFRDEALRMMENFDISAILISDYDKGFLTPEFIRKVIDLSTQKGIPVVADAKREPEIYSGSIIKCNFPYSVTYANPYDVCTNGPYRPYVRGKDPTGPLLPSVKCINHVGAGDCFASHLTLALAHGFPLEEAAMIAHSAGRVYVQHPHNRPPTMEEVLADFTTIYQER